MGHRCRRGVRARLRGLGGGRRVDLAICRGSERVHAPNTVLQACSCTSVSSMVPVTPTSLVSVTMRSVVRSSDSENVSSLVELYFNTASLVVKYPYAKSQTSKCVVQSWLTPVLSALVASMGSAHVDKAQMPSDGAATRDRAEAPAIDRAAPRICEGDVFDTALLALDAADVFAAAALRRAACFTALLVLGGGITTGLFFAPTGRSSNESEIDGLSQTQMCGLLLGHALLGGSQSVFISCLSFAGCCLFVVCFRGRLWLVCVWFHCFSRQRGPCLIEWIIGVASGFKLPTQVDKCIDAARYSILQILYGWRLISWRRIDHFGVVF